MTHRLTKNTKTQVVGLQKLKWLIYLCLKITIYLNGPSVILKWSELRYNTLVRFLLLSLLLLLFRNDWWIKAQPLYHFRCCFSTQCKIHTHPHTPPHTHTPRPITHTHPTTHTHTHTNTPPNSLTKLSTKQSFNQTNGLYVSITHADGFSLVWIGSELPIYA